MRLSDLPNYLFLGRRDAILRIASTPRALFIAAALVLTAAVARDYDGENLFFEPYHLLMPFGASLVTSFLTLVMLRATFLRRSEEHIAPSFFAQYRVFLTLFWLTAPLAWLYAIPYERFLKPDAALIANLWTLVVVSIWRVVLIVRVSAILFGVPIWKVAFPVLFTADTFAVIAGFHATYHEFQDTLFAGMAGIEPAPQSLISEFLDYVSFIIFPTWPLWVIGTAALMIRKKSGLHPVPVADPQPVVGGLLAFTAVTLIISAIAVGWTLQEQSLRLAVDRLMEQRDYAAAFAVMSKHQRSDFPARWDPRASPRNFNLLDDTAWKPIQSIAESRPADWVTDWYMERFRLHLQYMARSEYEPYFFKADEMAATLRRLPDGPALAAIVVPSFDRWYKHQHDESPQDIEALRQLAARHSPVVSP